MIFFSLKVVAALFRSSLGNLRARFYSNFGPAKKKKYIIPGYYLRQWDFPKWHGPLKARRHSGFHWDASAETEGLCAGHRATAAVHSRSLEIRATKPLITRWAHNPLSSAIRVKCYLIVTARPDGRAKEGRGQLGTRGSDRKWCNWEFHGGGPCLEFRLRCPRFVPNSVCPPVHQFRFYHRSSQGRQGDGVLGRRRGCTLHWDHWLPGDADVPVSWIDALFSGQRGVHLVYLC